MSFGVLFIFAWVLVALYFCVVDRFRAFGFGAGAFTRFATLLHLHELGSLVFFVHASLAYSGVGLAVYQMCSSLSLYAHHRHSRASLLRSAFSVLVRLATG